MKKVCFGEMATGDGRVATGGRVVINDRSCVSTRRAPLRDEADQRIIMSSLAFVW